MLISVLGITRHIKKINYDHQLPEFTTYCERDKIHLHTAKSQDKMGK